MEWEEDYNINYAQYTGSGKKRRRSKTTPVILGFDVKINISKRTQYCQENGMPIENYLHQEPTWQQTVAITADADFNLHFADGTNEPTSQELMEDTNILYLVVQFLRNKIICIFFCLGA